MQKIAAMFFSVLAFVITTQAVAEQKPADALLQCVSKENSFTQDQLDEFKQLIEGVFATKPLVAMLSDMARVCEKSSKKMTPSEFEKFLESFRKTAIQIGLIGVAQSMISFGAAYIEASADHIHHYGKISPDQLAQEYVEIKKQLMGFESFDGKLQALSKLAMLVQADGHVTRAEYKDFQKQVAFVLAARR